MQDVKSLKKRMLLLAVASAVVLSALTIVAALAYDTLVGKGLLTYIMAVPIFMTVLSFVLGYIDLNEDCSEDAVKDIVFRSNIFGGLMFVFTIIAIIAMMYA